MLHTDDLDCCFAHKVTQTVAAVDELNEERIGMALVDKNHRLKGIGRRLMEHVEGWAKEQGCSIVRLWSSSTRTTSHKFYEVLGYTNIKTQYSFIKSIDANQQQDLRKFVPKVDQ